MFHSPITRDSGQGTEVLRRYQAQEMICVEGESGLEMFVVRFGSVRIFKSSGEAQVELAVLGRGEFFGEMSALEDLPRDASAQATEPTEVLVLTPGALLVRLRRDPTFSFELLRKLSGRLRVLNSRLLEALDTDHQAAGSPRSSAAPQSR